MSLVHVFPLSEVSLHNTFQGGADCYCEPKILDLGEDAAGDPARVFVHQQLFNRELAAVTAERRMI